MDVDARIRVSAEGFVKSLQRRLGITTILATHGQADAYALVDRIAIIWDGELAHERARGNIDRVRRVAPR